MLEEIDKLGGVESIPTMVNRAKDKNDPFRLMGFGHRVYKVWLAVVEAMAGAGGRKGWVGGDRSWSIYATAQGVCHSARSPYNKTP